MVRSSTPPSDRARQLLSKGAEDTFWDALWLSSDFDFGFSSDLSWAFVGMTVFLGLAGIAKRFEFDIPGDQLGIPVDNLNIPEQMLDIPVKLSDIPSG